MDEQREHDATSPWNRDFKWFVAGCTVAWLGLQMQSVALGWEIYERTGSALALGWVGFVQVLPFLMFSLFAGHVADHHDRRKVLSWSALLMSLGGLGLVFLSSSGAHVTAMYGCVFLQASAKAFQQPARASLLPTLVSREAFPRAVAWNAGIFHLCSVVGPALGGLILALTRSPALIYLFDAVGLAFFAVVARAISARPRAETSSEMSLTELSAGARYVWAEKTILAAITLDMFAVLFGGAKTLLPVYAKDILHVGPGGLGWLEAMPAIGAVFMSLFLANRPPIERPGKTLLWAVAGFGVATIVFGGSKSYPLSLLALFLTGALDNVSVVIRHTLVQLGTPDSLRGRVSAINGVFISASNELGGFESGLVAHWLGPVVSVVGGGFGTLLVVAVVAVLFPTLSRSGRVDREEVFPEAAAKAAS